jgi:hypothetical protein
LNLPDLFDALGIKLSVAIAGLSGGLLRGLSRRKYTAREIIASPICGALAAAYLAEPAMHFLLSINWPLPDELPTALSAVAFVVGVSAMWIADLIFEALQRWVRGGRQSG